MALIGVDTYTPSPGVAGAAANASTRTASQSNTATNAATAAVNTTTAPQTGPQPLNASGPRGTTVNVVA